MDWLQFGVQWLHVILAVFWFGSTLYLDFVLLPSVATMPLASQRELGMRVAQRANRIFPIVSGLVILLGIVRGTAFGPVKSLDTLTSTYGLTWLASLVLAVVIGYIGARYIGAEASRLYGDDANWVVSSDGRPSAALIAGGARLRRNGQIEVVLFVAIFTLMILMRFGQ